MNVLKRFDAGGTRPRIGYRWLSAVFGIVTLVTFGTDRFLSETTGLSVGDAPAYVLGGVVLAVGASALYAPAQGRSVTTAILLAVGPVCGLALYLIGYHLVLPPSTDSPTWIVFLAFAGGFLALGTAAHLLGRLFAA